ncbi:MAG: hypothetical protein JW806_01350 [Sedimentisphaerales bacterium]|nr:hypothetical protein [Sedimentisphaerales bacterium]
MKNTKPISIFFIIAALYDGVLGVAFLTAGGRLFDLAKVTPPNHMGYIHFPAALLIVFAIMFLMIAADPKKNRQLIPYGILLKLSYCSVVFFHWFKTDIPHIWKPFAFIDIVFMVVFIAVFVLLADKQESI